MLPTYGDILLLDPEPQSEAYFRNFDLVGSQVAKFVQVDGELHDLEISPGGDKLTLVPSTTKVGYVTVPSDGFRATVYNDEAILKINGDKSDRVALASGRLEVDLLHDRPQREIGPGQSKGPSREGTTTAHHATLGSRSPRLQTDQGHRRQNGPLCPSVRRLNRWSPLRISLRPARASAWDSRWSARAAKSVPAWWSTVVAPAPPEFTISTPDGEEVDRGNFEYG